MLKLYSTQIDPEALRKKLEAFIATPPEILPLAERLRPAPPSFKQKLLRRFPPLRRVANAAKGWRMSGYSPRWLIKRLPGVRGVAAVLWTLINIRAFRHHVVSEIERLETLLQHATAQNRQLAARLEEETRLAPARIEALKGDVRLLERSMSSVQSRLGRIESGPVADPLHAREVGAAFPACYLALENIYRGSPEAIAARLEQYLPVILNAGVGAPDSPVLDLGCGRGEWLFLLRRHGLAALGVDSNPAMAGEAEQLGLHVVEGDLLSFLEDAAPNSFGAITAFQVVEHLNTADLLRLFMAAQRVLLPGGVLLLETPNPENLQVSGYSFWLDPTHVRPLPPPLLMHFARHFGFIDIGIERASPWAADLRLPEDSAAARHLNKLLFCEQDYALVARKPLDGSPHL